MDAHGHPARPEDLLAHAAWMRALAGDLVRDPHGADDLVQDAFLAAMRRPPSTDRSLRPWLATVLRRLASKRRRGEGRRDRREQEHAVGPAPLPPPDEVVARLEAHREVVDAVRALEEPFRSTVLLRYFDGLEPAEIAQRTGVPAATVRTRLHRGLAALRERLDDGRKGDRAAWRSAVLVLATTPDRTIAPALDGATGTGAATPAVAASAWWLGAAGLAAVLGIVLVAGAWRPGGSGSAGPGSIEPGPHGGRGTAGAGPSGTHAVDAAPAEPEKRPPAGRPADAAAESGAPSAVAAVAANTGALRVIVRPESEEETPPVGIRIAVTDAAGVVHRATGDAEGNAVLAALSPGRADVVVRAAGCVVAVQSARVSAGSQVEVRFELRRGVALRGRVTSLTGAPLEGATVTGIAGWASGDLSTLEEERSAEMPVLALRDRFRSLDRGRARPVDARTRTAADGTWVLEGLPSVGPVTVGASAAGHRPGTATVFAGAMQAPLDLVLASGGAVEGRVLDPSGAPLADIPVSATPLTDPDLDGTPGGALQLMEMQVSGTFVRQIPRGLRVAPRTRSGADGHYRIDGLEPGTLHRVIALHPRLGSAIAPSVRVAADATASGTDLRFLAPGSVEVTAPAGATVHIAGPGAVREAATVDGRHVEAELPPGAYRVIVRAAGRRIFGTTVEVEPGTRVAVVADPAEEALFHGTVTDDAGTAVAAAWVVVRPAPGDDADLLPPLVQTDADGRFVLRGLSPGTVRLRWGQFARFDGFSPDDGPVEGEFEVPTRESARLVLRRRGTVAARLVVPEGTPTPREVQVRWWEEGHDDPGDERVSWTGTASPDQAVSMAEGDLELTGVAAGEVRVAILAEGFAPAEAEGRLDPEGILDLGAILLQPGRSVEGIVVDASGEPVKGVRMRCGEGDSLALRTSVTDAAGRFRLDGLPPHGLLLRWDGDDLLDGAATTGDEGSVRITAQRGVVLEVRVGDGNGRPVGGVAVQPVGVDPGSEQHPRAITGGDGVARCRVPAGRWTIRTAPSAGAPVEVVGAEGETVIVPIRVDL